MRILSFFIFVLCIWSLDVFDGASRHERGSMTVANENVGIALQATLQRSGSLYGVVAADDLEDEFDEDEFEDETDESEEEEADVEDAEEEELEVEDALVEDDDGHPDDEDGERLGVEDTELRKQRKVAADAAAKTIGASSALEDLDEDEFEVGEACEEDGAATNAAKRSDAEAASAKSVEERKRLARERAAARSLSSYVMECIFGAIILVYGVVYYFGRRTNSLMAGRWALAVQPAIDENFAASLNSADAFVPQFFLEPITPSLFEVRVTGRRNCVGAKVTVDLKRRHDLYSLAMGIVNPVLDVVVLEIVMDPTAMPPLLFGVCRRKDYKMIKKEFPNMVGFHPVQHDVHGVPDSFVVYAQAGADEVIPQLLTSEVKQTLSAHEKQIMHIHMCDYYSLSDNQHRNVLRFKYRVAGVDASRDQDQVAQQLIRMSFFFIDRLASLTLGGAASQAALKQRDALKKLAAKEAARAKREQVEEAAAQRRKEKDAKEKERLSKLSDAERAKLEAKMEKKANKQKMNARIKVIK